MFTFKVQYKDENGNISNIDLVMYGESRELARVNLERSFKEQFHNCILIHIG